jgi:hypothetical protein
MGFCPTSGRESFDASALGIAEALVHRHFLMPMHLVLSKPKKAQ